MLALQIGFPGGRYYAASISDPRQPEWPPHPSRVFSALVAAAYAGGRQPSDAERTLLHKLESAPPPSVAFPDADLRPAPDTYVPVNDPKSRIEARKGQSQGVLLPNRQVRQFPGAFMLDEPEVVLAWPLRFTDDEVEALDRLASRVTHLGTSHSFVTASFRMTELPVAARLVPNPSGTEYLRVPQPGRLDELDRIANQGHGTLRRPSPRCEISMPYATAHEAANERAPSTYDWVTLRFLDASWGADTAHTLGRALRRAVLSIAGDDAPALIHGHDPSAPHLAWLPLPDVGHAHARGRIRGLAVALPLAASDFDRGLALAALARLQELRLPDGQVARVSASIDGPETPIVLRPATWLGPSRHWSTVTPVILDRPPKRPTAEAILEALAVSVENAGYPRPLSLSASRTSDFDGAPGALDIPTRMPRYHARVVFAQPVRGPVLVGRWRNFGIGLLRPTPEEPAT